MLRELGRARSRGLGVNRRSPCSTTWPDRKTMRIDLG